MGGRAVVFAGHLLVAGLLLLLLRGTEGAELMLQVGAGREECFYEQMERNKTLYLDFSVVSSNKGELDINFQLSDGHGRPLISEFRKSESKHEFLVQEDGVYKMCFDNTFSHFSHKTIAFHVSNYNEEATQWNDYDDFLTNPDPKDLLIGMVLGIKEMVERTRVNLNKIQGIQDQFRLMELKDRTIAEGNFERVNFWSMVYVVVFVVVGCGQVVLLKSLFDDKYNVKRLISKVKG